MFNKKFFVLIYLISLTNNVCSAAITQNRLCQIDNAAVGFGTYPLRGSLCQQALNRAIKAGYRIIDTATFYRNLDAIGGVLKKNKRSNFYIISKVWPNSHKPDQLREDLKKTLKALQTNYLDAYLLHWPNSTVSIKDTLTAMNELRIQGLIRHIGLSNVTVNHLKKALEVGVPIKWVQVEMHPFYYDAELLKFCAEHSIDIQAWAPLARGLAAADPYLAALGKKYGKNAAQMALKWIVQHGCIPLPSSKNPTHLTINQDIFDFSISQQDMDAIDDRAKKGKRERVTASMGLGFTDEFDFTYEQCWPAKK